MKTAVFWPAAETAPLLDTTTSLERFINKTDLPNINTNTRNFSISLEHLHFWDDAAVQDPVRKEPSPHRQCVRWFLRTSHHFFFFFLVDMRPDNNRRLLFVVWYKEELSLSRGRHSVWGTALTEMLLEAFLSPPKSAHLKPHDEEYSVDSLFPVITNWAVISTPL